MISDFFLALLLALIQGLTEFLPVSSSAHLLFPSLLFGAKDFGIVFDISVHAGTLAAVIYYFKKEIQGLLQAWNPWSKTRNTENFSLGLNLIVATLPIVLVGLLVSDLAKSDTSNPTKTIGKVATMRFNPREKFSVFLVFDQGFQAWSNP